MRICSVDLHTQDLQFIKLDDINWYGDFTYFVLNPILYFFWLASGYALHYLFFFVLSVFRHLSLYHLMLFSPLVVTGQGDLLNMDESAWAITQLDTHDIQTVSRTMAEALTGIPSVMVQKTALGQSSPYIRGLTIS